MTIELHLGDCLDVMRSMPAGSVDMVFADPPFNAGKEYANDIDDDLPLADYRLWLTKWIEPAERMLAWGGTFWLMQNQKHIGYCQMELERIGLEFMNIVCWVYTNPTPAVKRFPQTWRPILLFSKGPPSVFNWHEDQMIKETLYYNPDRAKTHYPNDLWPDIPKLVGGFLAQPELILTEEKRFAHLAQMPERIAERAIKIATLPGQNILDPFMGSGTVGAACNKLCRSYIGIEKSAVYFEIAQRRIAQAEMQPQLFKQPAPIEMQGALIEC